MKVRFIYYLEILRIPTNQIFADPKIAEGLVQLYEMGFSNDHGMLTSLLERFDGNVALVVKALIDLKN